MDETLLSAVKELTARQLGLSAERIDPDQTFVGLGGDSLTLVAMTRDLEMAYGMTMPVRDLFDTVDTPRKLAYALTTAYSAAGSEPEDKPGSNPLDPALEESGPRSPDLPSSDTRYLFADQLRLADKMVSEVSGLIRRQLELMSREPKPQPPGPERPPASAPAPSPTPVTAPGPMSQAPVGRRDTCDISLYFFGDYPADRAAAGYQSLIEAAEFADQSGFHAVWLPERHFHSFGGLFPNPSVLAAALATRTSRIRLHAGSVVLPLHNPIRVAEEWSVVDNLSGGRIGLCVASGWHANDFALAPDHYGAHKDLMYDQLETVRRLWSGAPMEGVSGTGEPIEITLYPRPVQSSPPLLTAVVGNPESYRRAARNDLGIVTNLMTQDIETLGANIALYRRTRAEHGLDPAAGRVVVLVHTYLDEDTEAARQEAYAPFCAYLRSSLSLLDQVVNSLDMQVDLEHMTPEDVDFLTRRAYQRYCDERALIGSPETSKPIMDALVAAGVDEIGCFVDFGLPAERMLAGLRPLERLRAAGIEPRGEPVSAAQRRLWLVGRMYPGSMAYHEPKAILLDGPLDVAALRAALDKVVARHPQLNAVFVEVDGEPRRFHRPAHPMACPIVDLTGHDLREAVRVLVRAETNDPFDISRGPLFRARLARIADGQHILFLLVHHIVFDSFSTTVFCRDLAAFYRSHPGIPADLPEPRSVLPRAAAPERLGPGLAFWKEELRGATPLTLPADRPRSGRPSTRGGSLIYEFDAALVERAEAIGRAQGCTPFMTHLGVIAAVLSRVSGQDDVLLGTAVTDRPPGTEDVIGMFVETVVLRLDLSGDPIADELMRRVRTACTNAYEHRDVPFDDVVTALNPQRMAGTNPLIGVMVEYEEAAPVEFAPPHLDARVIDVAGEHTPFDLSLCMTRHEDGLRCTAIYDAGLFDETSVHRVLTYLETVLRRVVTMPGAAVSALTRPADAVEVSRRPSDDRATENQSSACLHRLVERQVRRTPHASALVSGEVTVSYEELDTAANRLARTLLRRGAGRGKVVAVFLSRGVESIKALLAVLKTGGAYLPIDPGLPLERVREYLGRGAHILLTDERLTTAHPELGAYPTILIDDVDLSVSGEPPDVAVGPDDPAYCIFTSGTTGCPKGVLVPHGGPANLVSWQLTEHPPLTTLQWTSLAFDLSVQEIFTTLASGAALVLIDDEMRADLPAVAEVMRRHDVQRLLMPFGVLRNLVRRHESLPALREIFTGGEKLVFGPALRDFLDRHPKVRLFHQYGPTEASVIVTSHEVVDRQEPMPPIGRPIAGVTVRLLDRNGRSVPVGSVGEVHIGDPALAHGYLDDPARTAEAFVPDPELPGRRLYRTGDLARSRPTGELDFIGRTDDQVKIRGHRVEPGEVQCALAQLPGVRESAVVARRSDDGTARLIAYVVPSGESFSPRTLRDLLGRRLPSHLIPERWVSLTELPIGPNGKLQTRELPEPPSDVGVESGRMPSTEVERRLHSLWCDELNLTSLSVDASFFDSGGNSMNAVRLLYQVYEEFGVQFPFTDFIHEPTIDAMSAGITAMAQHP